MTFLLSFFVSMHARNLLFTCLICVQLYKQDDHFMACMSLFLSDVANLRLVVRLVETQDDFYVKFTSMRLLTKLLIFHGDEVVNAVVENPAGLSRIVETLQDKSEMIRNGFYCISYPLSQLLVSGSLLVSLCLCE